MADMAASNFILNNKTSSKFYYHKDVAIFEEPSNQTQKSTLFGNRIQRENLNFEECSVGTLCLFEFVCLSTFHRCPLTLHRSDHVYICLTFHAASFYTAASCYYFCNFHIRSVSYDSTMNEGSGHYQLLSYLELTNQSLAEVLKYALNRNPCL